MSDEAAAPGRPVRTPKCSRCRNHGVLVPVRGHSGHCGWKLCSCPKCALVTERQKIMASHKKLRREAQCRATPEERGETSSSRHALSTPKPECMLSLVNFERETTRMCLACPPLYHYSAFPMGLPPPDFRSAAPPLQAPIPLTSIRPYNPFGWRMQQDGGDFCSQGYYPSFPPFMPSRYLPGSHYMPPYVPMGVSMRAEPSRTMLAPHSAEDQSLINVVEEDKTSKKEPHY